jgi:homoserine dehydrogenase
VTSSNNDKNYGIGLAGCGTVGTGVIRALQRNGELIRQRTGGQMTMQVKRVLVRDATKSRDEAVDATMLTTDWRAVVEDPAVQLVVELIGGTGLAFEIVARALELGKPVVTGNKALLAERGVELFALSKKYQVPIHFEAAVAGGIPIIKTVQEAFVGNRMTALCGIINGTSNYILQRMSEARLDFQTALGEAQALGYAEADPTLDVNGWDAAHKAILLATLAYGFPISPADVHVVGIEQVKPIDIDFAKQLGYVVKLLAVIREHADGAVELRLQPSFVSKTHILASVNGVFNAVAVHGDGVGDALFYGRGAGQDPTASAVVADLVEAARSLSHDQGHRGFLPWAAQGRLLPIEETKTAYYVRFDVTDRPGVIAEIARVLAEHCIGISGTHSPVNPENPDAAFVDMVFLLHSCPFGLLQTALKEIFALDCVNSEPVVFRIEQL